ncbi:oligosaccharide flippase family protein [Proteus mirabilis]|uniref:oligosaccharide flippase family protein n=1 Tax=Proteus mirabilis TaxID=584 RepID=UPI003D09171A
MNIINKIIKHSIFKNTLALSIIKILDIILPLITIPYLTRVLSLNDFGLLIISLAIYNLANILTDFGFGLSTPYTIAKNKNNSIFLNNYISSIFILKIILFIFSIVFIVLYYNSINSHIIDITIIYLTIAIVLSLTFQTPWFFIGIEKMKTITLLTSLSKLLYFFLIFLIVPYYKSINSVLLSIFISNLIASIFYFILIRKFGIQFKLVKFKYIIIIFKENIGFFISRISVHLSTTMNGILIGSILGSTSSAIYGAADKLYNAGIGLMSPISNALYPNMARTKNLKLLIIITLFLFFTSSIFCIIISNFTDIIIPTIFGSKYNDSVQYFNLMLYLVPINIISILFGYTAFSIIDKTNITNYTVIISAIIYIISLLILYFTKQFSIKNLIYMIILIDSITLFFRLTIFSFLYSRKKQSVK